MSKKRRLKRVLRDGRTVIVPMDHGVSKPIAGLEEVERILKEIDGIVDAVVLHKGVAKRVDYVNEMDMGLIVHLSASTCLVEPNEKVLVTSVEKAIKLGADAVSIHVNLGSKTEREQLRDLGIVSEICDDWGIPLLAMVYARGEGLNERDPELVKHCVRVAYELGADIVKTAYTGSVESFAEVVELAEIPVVIAGGSKKSEFEILREVAEAMNAGASGVAIGRNVFQHRNPKAMAKALRMIVHENASLKEVII
ncbi:2-amino-3,7-dideoxy-D-threo-hept-6-ulosonate synthase [Archaeoglobus profundus]|uniref:2-amino-3,7-dideoxy-D-threo-hept-6-ulosonate synthase n=1 Tax=Archaeoglobus profundus (strain DSM 5631 / JCM 9629 / NBRC 100127 / Av18) TaxID=572546 RepID=D2RIA9_ARCPA|nr:2-amino-3,7-dideoxy-D-threo-hept-6-ulosonate synthase [Archaeoglobus profundus]ADB58034.1 predicted phospho-2-dehydro-3-deoxyheptonate aldolase [Archaeoglobus profundus DSM 5631]